MSVRRKKHKFFFIAPKIQLVIDESESRCLSAWFQAQQTLRNKILSIWAKEREIILREPDPSLHSPHFGLLYLAGWLLREGYEVEYIDQEWEERQKKWHLALEKVEKEAIAILIAGITITYPQVRELVKFFKKRTDAILVVGGHHVSYRDKDALYDGADIVIRGEGELAVSVLASEIINGRYHWESVPNASFLHKNKVIRNEQKYLVNLDLLPRFPYHLLSEEQRHTQEMYIFPSRGCKYSCTFCIEGGRYWKNHYLIPPEKVSKAILIHQSQTPFNTVYLYDSNFGENKEWTLRLCELLAKDHPNVYFRTLARLDLLDEELIDAFKSAKVIEILIGIESGNERIRSFSGKKMSDIYIIEKLSKLQTAIPLIKTSWIMGLPGETTQSAQNTLEIIKFMHLNRLVSEASCRVATYYPGTQVFENPKKFGVEFYSYNWSRYHRRCVPPYHLENMRAKEIYTYYRQAVEMETILMRRRIESL